MAEMGGVDTSIYKAPERPNMLERAGQAIGVVQGMTDAQQKQFNLAKGQMDYWAPKVGSFVFDPRWKTGDVAGIRKDIMRTVGDAVNLKLLAPMQGAAMLHSLPDDDAHLHDALQSTWVQFQSAAEQLDAMASPMSQDTGGEVPYGTFNKLDNTFSEAGRFKKTPTPEFLAAPMDAVIPSGENRGAHAPITHRQFLEQTDPGMLSGAAPDIGAAAGGGPIPEAAPPAPGSVPATGRIMTSLPPGEAESMVKAAEGPAAAAGDAQVASATWKTRIAVPLEQAITSLQRLGPQGTGPGSETFNQVMSFMQTMAPSIAAVVPGFDPANVQDWDEANKYLTRYATAYGASVGGALTNDKLAAAFTGTPNMHTSNLATVDLLKMTFALERMGQAQARAFADDLAQGKVSPSKYATWSQDWQAKQDPRAYALDLMSKPAATKLVNSLKDDEKTKFYASAALARKYDLISNQRQQSLYPTKQ